MPSRDENSQRCSNMHTFHSSSFMRNIFIVLAVGGYFSSMHAYLILATLCEGHLKTTNKSDFSL